MSEVRLIDAIQLHRQIMEDAGYDFSKKLNLAQCLLYIEKALTIEAEPVKHGYWIMNNPYGIKCCSECGYGQSIGAENYCPNCGAKMHNDRAETAQLIENESTAFCMVPYSERIPDKDGKYLVLLNNNAWDILNYDTELRQFGWTDEYKDEFGYNITDWYDSTEMVVSWMPLPEKL